MPYMESKNPPGIFGVTTVYGEEIANDISKWQIAQHHETQYLVISRGPHGNAVVRRFNMRHVISWGWI